ncbi:hypothetical protein [Actinokineospora sp. NPDC004072]
MRSEGRVEMSYGARVAAHGAVSAALASRSEDELADLVERAAPLGAGIGGTSALLEVDGVPVFVKRVPLTDLERRPEHVGSTANVFGLPSSCHYGVGLIGAPGFGAWRELAVHTMTTEWVLAGEHEGFPLMHHWRVLPHPGQALPEELADVAAAVAYWGGGPQVRARIEGLRDASASIALFLEHLPHNLHDWLADRIKAGEDDSAAVERELLAGTAFMNSRGLLHFDVHFQNILTDGQRLYFADYGLAISSRFDLSDEEAAFFAEHQAYDRCYSVTHLVIWLVTELFGYRGEERRAFVRACAQGERPTGIAPDAAAVIARHAPVATAMTDFYHRFQVDSREARFPIP